VLWRRREIRDLGAALVILAAVAVLAYRSIAAAGETLGWVEHTNLVLQQIGEVQGAYARAAAARRAYAVGGDASQLGNVGELDARLAAALAAVRSSVADSPGQIARVDQLRHLIGQRVALLDAAVETRGRTGASVETGEDLTLATRVRVVREDMEREEDRLLAERDARTRRDVTMTKVAEIVGTLTSFAILLIAFRRLRQEVARRDRSEQALRGSEAFLDSIVENLPNMIFVKEAGELRFARINRAGESLLGLDRAELLGKSDFDFFPREQAEFFRERDRECLARGVVVDVTEEPIQTASGERWLHTKKVPIVDEHGAPAHLLGISEDVTERRKAAAALQAAKDAAEGANRELEAFSYSVAHDLRAPLRAISGFSTALLEDAADRLDGESRRHLDRIVAGAERMAQLIDALLALSRLNRAPLRSDSVDLSSVARTVAEQLASAEPSRSVEFTAQEGLMTQGDARLLRALLENLLGNAWKFTRKRPAARVELGREETPDGAAVYYVRDNGAGFDMALADRLFGPFQRLHKDTDFEGTGIGLATVQRIVRRHGGKVWAEGKVGEGATIRFTLPGGDALR
jgi:PAS domain S-box-containing protein